MSNSVYFQKKKFLKLDDTGEMGKVSYGYTISNNDKSISYNDFDSFKELNAKISLNNILNFIENNYESFMFLIERNGLYYCGEFFTWEEIKRINKYD